MSVSYTHLDVYKRQVCGGRGLAQGFNLLCVFCKIVSKSVCDLYYNCSLSMLFGCVVWCLYISYCSAVLGFRPLGKQCNISRLVSMLVQLWFFVWQTQNVYCCWIKLLSVQSNEMKKIFLSGRCRNYCSHYILICKHLFLSLIHIQMCIRDRDNDVSNYI